MTHLTRRELLRVGAALAGAAGLGPALGTVLAAGLEDLASQRAKVIWLEGMSCSGCSVSLLNTENPGPLELLTEIISLIFHPTVGAAQGDICTEVLAKAAGESDYFLVVEGAIPMAMPQACSIGGRPLTELLPPLLKNARGIIAAGTCAAFGGIPAAEGNLTGAASCAHSCSNSGLPGKGD